MVTGSNVSRGENTVSCKCKMKLPRNASGGRGTQDSDSWVKMNCVTPGVG
jgi:hypothetical protein